MVYQLPSSFSGGMQGAVDSLKKGTLPQAINSPVIQPAAVKQTFLPPKPAPVDPNKTAEVFKKKFIEKHGDGVAQDGRKYSEIPAPEIVAKVIRKYGDGVTTDGTPYRDYLPRPASPDDSLEYRLKQIESLSTAPKSEFSTNGIIRGQTEKEKQFTTEVMDRKNENELVKTIKAPYRGLESVGQNLAFGTAGVAADVIDTFGGDELSGKIRSAVDQEKFTGSLGKDTSKGILGSPSAALETLSSGVGYMLTGAKIPLYLTALVGGGNLSIEGEQQGQGDFRDKLTAYTAGGISAAIDRMSGQKVIGGLERAGIKKETATTFVQKMNNYMKGLKPSDFEAGTEIIQQKIENIARDVMGIEYDKGIQQYFEVGLLGKVLGKIGDKGFSESPVTTLPPAPPKTPKYVNNNLGVIQGIRTGIKGNDIVTNAKARGFDPETDVATYKELKPDIDKDGRVNTDDAQVNLKKHVDPMQNTVTELIKAEQKTVPIDTAYQVMKQMIDEDLGTGLNYEAAMNRLEVARRTLERNAKNGQVDLAALDEMKKTIYSETDYTKDNDKADKAIARGIKEVIEQNVTNAKIKELNNELARWYTTRQYLRLLGTGTKTVKGGRLGGYGASLTGTIIGSMIGSMGGPITGAIGGFVGREVSSKIHGNMLKNVLSDSETKLPTSKKFTEVNMALQNKKANMALPPPSGLPISGNVVDANVRTGYAPGVMQSMNIENTSDRVSPTLPQPTLLPLKKTPQKLPPVSKATKQASVKGKESKTGESIKAPIIQKTEVKAKLPVKKEVTETPKTPQVEEKTVPLVIKPTPLAVKSSKDVNFKPKQLAIEGKLTPAKLDELLPITQQRVTYMEKGRPFLWTKSTKGEWIEGVTGAKASPKTIPMLDKMAEEQFIPASKIVEDLFKETEVKGKVINYMRDSGNLSSDQRIVLQEMKNLDLVEQATIDNPFIKGEKMNVWKLKDNKPKPSLPLSSKSEVKYSKKDIANKKYNPTEIYKDYTENYMHSDKWKGKSKAIVIDSDSIKKMFNEYDPKNPGLVHEESSKLSKEFFDRAVAENPDSPVIFSAGGPASGKSEGIINQYHGDKNIIFDTVLGDFKGFLKKAKSKIDSGKVKVHAIYTDIDTAKIYNAGRERSVSEELLTEKHKGFRNAMNDLINSKEYKEGKIAVEIRSNNGRNSADIPSNRVEQFISEHKNRLDIK